MTHFDPKSLETAFLPPGTLSIADCMARLEAAQDLSAVRRRDLLSGLRRLASFLGRPPALLPADPLWLQPRLQRLEPAALGLTPKSLSNILSNARAALLTCGIVEQRVRRLDDLSPLWQPLWDSVQGSRNLSLTTSLGRFIRFLDNMGVAPGEVGPEHLALYGEALALNELRKDPQRGARHALTAWNRATQVLADWPQQTLPVPRSETIYRLPLDTFPASFAEDLARFVQSREHPDPLDPLALRAAQRPATVRHRRAQVLRFASALVHAGVAPGEIRSLADLVTPERARTGLTWLHARQGHQTSSGLADVAILLKTLARHHVFCSPEDLRMITSYADRLAAPRPGGMTPKNRERLRPFEDPAALQRLFALPFRLFEQNKGQRGLKAAFKREEALAIALLLHCPIRRKNLATLHLERNLRRMRDGRVVLCFEGAEVKNRRSLEFDLPAAVVAMLEAHLATRAPELGPAGTPWLFPRRDGGAPMELSSLSRRISARIKTETGLEVHVHLFRHLAAKVLLEAHPGHYEVVRRLLGHAELSSTLSAYIGLEAGTATRLYAELITKARGDAA